MSIPLHSERRSNLKMQPAVPVPLEHLEPHTPELSQLISQWQKLWLLAVARQKHLEQHQQALKEVHALLFHLFKKKKKSSSRTHCLYTNANAAFFFPTDGRICKLWLQYLAKALHAVDQPPEVADLGRVPQYRPGPGRTHQPQGVHRLRPCL